MFDHQAIGNQTLTFFYKLFSSPALLSSIFCIMASAIWGYLGYKTSPPPAEDEKHAVRALPASWYTSKEMYELERRAIFSRKWLLITHKLRLTKPGEWIKYNIANFQFILCRDRSGNINGFHNICRHRAYPLVEGQEGTAKIFSCRYHGWSYGLNGKLAKAPGYQELDDFDKSVNGLLPIHVHVDVNGFIWVNLDGKEKPEIAWEDDFNNIDKQERYKPYNFDNYEFDHCWEMEGAFNWKILADNYNECYHCPTTHPDIPDLANLESYNVKVSCNYILHDTATTEAQAAQGLTVAPTYFFPNTSSNVSPHFFFMQRFDPNSPSSSTMRYEVYRNKNSSEEDFQRINQMYKRIMSEDKVLCDLAQRNVNAGTFINGEMHPVMEKGPLFFQNLCRETVMAHHKREQAAKKEIWPARQVLPNQANSAATQKDLDFCASLTCQTTPKETLVW